MGSDLFPDDPAQSAEAEARSLRRDAERYRWLRSRPTDTIDCGGVFAGRTPQNVILTGADLDRAVDAAMSAGRKGADHAA